MQQKLKNRVAIVTGASRGIGRATCLALAREGVNIVATARDASQLDGLASECESLGVTTIITAADARDPDAVAALRERVLNRFSGVDILVNNAGVGKYGDLTDMEEADYDWMMDTNMKSTFLFSRIFVPDLIARGHGNLIVVSSQAGLHGYPGEAIYCATKHAQVGFATALDGELRPHNVKVTLICPGGVRTTFAFGTGRDEETPTLPDMLEADDVAEAIVFACKQSDKARMPVIELRPMNEKRYGGA